MGDGLPTKQSLKDFIIGLQKSNVTVCTINCYARSYNSYLTWLYKEGYVSEPLRLALLREKRRVFKPLNDQPSSLGLEGCECSNPADKPRLIKRMVAHKTFILAKHYLRIL